MTESRQKLYALLCGQYLPAFLGFARSRVGDMDTAEELCQEMAFRCVNAIAEDRIRDNPDAYFWSVAHNVCKSYYARKQPLSIEAYELGNVLPADTLSLEEETVIREEYADVRRALSHLSGLYRKILVMHYYDEMPVKAIAHTLAVSEGTVKFYLRSGREKLKEVYLMQNTTVSVKPVEFSVYKAAIDFSRVNVWEVFSRKLPAQLAILCHDKPMTVSALSVETGVPAVYLEEEIALLLDAGVMISPAKDKYRTNFHILKKNAFAQIKSMYAAMYREYLPVYRAVYDRYLPRLRTSGLFRCVADEQEYRWSFFMQAPAFDWRNIYTSTKDYPQILSCGSKALIYAMEEDASQNFCTGNTPTDLDATDRYPRATVWACDVTAFGAFHRQEELHPREHTDKCRVLCDIAMGVALSDDENTRLLISELIREGYVSMENGKPVSRVPVIDSAVRALFDEIGQELQAALEDASKRLYQRISDVVRATLVPQLADYSHGFTVTWLGFLEGALFDALYNDGFLMIPEEGDNKPYACRIVLHD